MFEVTSYRDSQYDAAVKLKIDLTSYIHAIEKYIENQFEELVFEEVRIEYNKAFLGFNGINGALLWEEIVSELFKLTSLTEATIKSIKESDLFTHFKNFAAIEIIKNTADECLYRFFSPFSQQSEYTIELFFKLSLDTNKIILDIQDTGRGFPDALLVRFSDLDGLCNYLLQDGSYKAQHAVCDSPLSFRVFGGCGIGLREIISYIKFGERLADINKKIFSLSALSSVEKIKVVSSFMSSQHQLLFQNSQHGAEIKISMPLFSRVLEDSVSRHETAEQKLVLQSPMFFKFLRTKKIIGESDKSLTLLAKS